MVPRGVVVSPPLLEGRDEVCGSGHNALLGVVNTFERGYPLSIDAGVLEAPPFVADRTLPVIRGIESRLPYLPSAGDTGISRCHLYILMIRYVEYFELIVCRRFWSIFQKLLGIKYEGGLMR